MNGFRWLTVAVLAAVLTGCGGSSPAVQQQDEDLFGPYGGGAGADAGQGGESGGMDDGLGAGSEFGDESAGGPVTAPDGGPGGALENRVIYFDFDRSDVRDEYRRLLSGHARYLAANPAVRVRLEGHADERGSREYNIGLGERRAQSVRQLLLLQGASATQLSTVSYGEERPAVLGSDDEAYQLNRRVELVYGR